MRNTSRLASLSLLSLLALGASGLACAAPMDGDEAQSGEAAATVDRGLGEELEEGEDALVRRIADGAATQLRNAQASSGDRVARRDAHPKAHGCVTASFTLDRDVPEGLRVGTFVPGKRYDAWVRFSNGSKQDDRESDARGMAIKLLGVDGSRLLTSEGPNAHTHDFVLSNHHTFFLADLAEYVKFMDTVTEKGNPLSFFFSWNPFDLHLGAAWLARSFTTQPISNPLTSRYWSVTPYALGRRAVKYSALPCDGADTSGDHADAPDYLASAMKQTLAGGSACFRFAVQQRSETGGMPIEDSTKTWDEDDAPFTEIATLRIARQAFDAPDQQAYCENLSFTPWHATTPHRPLGRTNRARRVVYETTQDVRHRLNGVQRVEPTDLSVPPRAR
jgi:hypothetical protein